MEKSLSEKVNGRSRISFSEFETDVVQGKLKKLEEWNRTFTEDIKRCDRKQEDVCEILKSIPENNFTMDSNLPTETIEFNNADRCAADCSCGKITVYTDIEKETCDCKIDVQFRNADICLESPNPSRLQAIFDRKRCRLEKIIKEMLDKTDEKTLKLNKCLKERREELDKRPAIQQKVFDLCKQIRELEFELYKIKHEACIDGRSVTCPPKVEKFSCKVEIRKVIKFQKKVEKIRNASMMKQSLYKTSKHEECHIKLEIVDLKEDIKNCLQIIEEYTKELRYIQKGICQDWCKPKTGSKEECKENRAMIEMRTKDREEPRIDGNRCERSKKKPGDKFSRDVCPHVEDRNEKDVPSTSGKTNRQPPKADKNSPSLSIPPHLEPDPSKQQDIDVIKPPAPERSETTKVEQLKQGETSEAENAENYKQELGSPRTTKIPVITVETPVDPPPQSDVKIPVITIETGQGQKEESTTTTSETTSERTKSDTVLSKKNKHENNDSHRGPPPGGASNNREHGPVCGCQCYSKFKNGCSREGDRNNNSGNRGSDHRTKGRKRGSDQHKETEEIRRRKKPKKENTEDGGKITRKSHGDSSKSDLHYAKSKSHHSDYSDKTHKTDGKRRKESKKSTTKANDRILMEPGGHSVKQTFSDINGKRLFSQLPVIQEVVKIPKRLECVANQSSFPMSNKCISEYSNDTSSCHCGFITGCGHHIGRQFPRCPFAIAGSVSYNSTIDSSYFVNYPAKIDKETLTDLSSIPDGTLAVSILSSSSDVATVTVTGVQENMKQLEEANAKLSQDMRSLEEKYELCQSEVTKYKNNYELLVAENVKAENLVDKLNSLERENLILQERINQSCKNLKERDSENQFLLLENERIRSREDQSRRKIESLENQISLLTSQNNSLLADYEASERKLKTCMENLKQCSNQFLQVPANDSITGRLPTEDADSNEWMGFCHGLIEKFNEVKIKLSRHAFTTKMIEEERNDLVAENENLKESLQRAHENFKRISNEYTGVSLRSQVEMLRRELDEQKDAMRRLNETNSRLMQEKHQFENLIKVRDEELRLCRESLRRQDLTLRKQSSRDVSSKFQLNRSHMKEQGTIKPYKRNSLSNSSGPGKSQNSSISSSKRFALHKSHSDKRNCDFGLYQLLQNQIQKVIKRISKKPGSENIYQELMDINRAVKCTRKRIEKGLMQTPKETRNGNKNLDASLRNIYEKMQAAGIDSLNSKELVKLHDGGYQAGRDCTKSILKNRYSSQDSCAKDSKSAAISTSKTSGRTKLKKLEVDIVATEKMISRLMKNSKS